jgi:hypothetical protein
MLPGITPSLIVGASEYKIARSARFRTYDSAYMHRAGATIGNKQKWTFSAWVKRGLLYTYNIIFSAGSNNSVFGFFDGTLNYYEYNGSSTTTHLISTALYRDVSAWMHVMVVFDTPHATPSERVKIFVNGVRVTSFSTATYPAQNYSSYWNGNYSQYIGVDAANGRYFDGYYADLHMVDGLALAPSAFGKTNPLTGAWSPVPYGGSVGTNGYKLNFSDNSSVSALGKDSSGMGHDFTTVNFSLAADTTNDSVLDSPTDYTDANGVARGNYSTLNGNDAQNIGLIRGGLHHYGVVASAWHAVRSTLAVPASGHWWMEFYVSTVNNTMLGVCSASIPIPDYPGQVAQSVGYQGSGAFYVDGVQTGSSSGYGTAQIAIRIDNGAVYFYKWAGSYWDLAGTGPVATNLTGDVQICSAHYDGYTAVANFGQQPWVAALPAAAAGAKSWCTQNLPKPVIEIPSQYFDINLRTGTGAWADIDTAKGFTPDLIYTHCRSAAQEQGIYDTVRGQQKDLNIPTPAIETFEANGIIFDGAPTPGFTVGSLAKLNTNGATYVDWMWKKGVLPGLDIVAATQSAAAVPHALGVKPDLIIIRNRVAATHWWMTFPWPGTNMNDHYVGLSTNGAWSTTANAWGGEPTATHFYCSTSMMNAGANYMAYLFRNVPGFSKVGYYSGNTTYYPFVHCGFRPRFLMMREIGIAANWWIIDSARQDFNGKVAILWPDYLSAEYTTDLAGTGIDIVSNGFKFRHGGGGHNTTGYGCLYIAFAETPFKYARAR